MNQPPDWQLYGAQIVELVERGLLVVLFAGVLDGLGGGPTLLGTTVVIAAFAAFLALRTALVVTTLVWFDEYIHSVSRRNAAASLGIIGVFAAGAILFAYGIYEFGMEPTYSSQALAVGTAAYLIKQYADYEFSLNDQTIISGGKN